MECNKCLLSIDRSKDRYTICEGRCAKRYHAACVGLSEATVCALFTKNILWMCDDCLSEYCINRDADIPLLTTADAVQTNTVESDIVEMKLKIEQIFDTLATIAPYHQPHFCENLHSTSVSSPALSSTRLLHGTKISQDDDTSAGAITHDAKGSETFSLFLTNVDCRTTEEDVNHLCCVRKKYHSSQFAYPRRSLRKSGNVQSPLHTSSCAQSEETTGWKIPRNYAQKIYLHRDAWRLVCKTGSSTQQKGQAKEKHHQYFSTSGMTNTKRRK